MTPAQFLDDLAQSVYCRLGMSTIAGIGVIAIRPIPAGINPIQESSEIEFIEVPVNDLKGRTDIPDTVKKLVQDMCPERDGVYDAPNISLNEIGLAFYLNHSPSPNMYEKDGYFYTIRAIEPGEELTVDYGTYGELNLG